MIIDIQASCFSADSENNPNPIFLQVQMITTWIQSSMNI